MTIWILISHQCDYSASYAAGVFSSESLAKQRRAEAEASAKKIGDTSTFFTVDALELDKWEPWNG